MSRPQISFITVNYNGLADTIELIDSINKLVLDLSFEIIVVDNASKKDPSNFFHETYPDVLFIRSEKNLGFAGGNNLGIKHSSGQYLFFVNNDTTLTGELTPGMVRRFEENPSLGMLSPKILFHNSNVIQYAGFMPLDSFARNSSIGNKERDSELYRGYLETYSGHGAAMMVPREVINKVGMMPELFFLYYEELDWACQIRNHGYSICVDQQLIIYHKESMSVGKTSSLKIYYHFRNRILFVRRNYDSIRKVFTLSYLVIVVFIKNYLKSLFTNNPATASLHWKALVWNFKN